jgi:DNA processing protein
MDETVTDDGGYTAWRLHHWLALNRAPLACTTRLRILREYRSSPDILFGAREEAAFPRGIGDRAMEYFRCPDWRGVERDLAWLQRPGNGLLAIGDANYPTLLRAIADPPLVLFVRGEPSVLGRAQVAVVGTRKPSPDGRRMAFALARDLAGRGIAVCSGLALGIDTEAHRGALHDSGSTVAVLGNGLDRVYPASNAALAGSIAEHGALVSEFPVDAVPLAENFPQRNRLISGLSVAVVVVEAALRSGSLITARHALEQGRDVFAVPGSVFNPVAAGCHELIRQGAALAASVDDVVAETRALAAFAIGAATPQHHAPPVPALDDAGKLLLHNIGYSAMTVDMLVDATGIPADTVIATLCALEVAGVVATTSTGGFVRRS